MAFSSSRVIAKSELIVNDNGSIFHLHLLPGQLSEKIVLCGDPDRVTKIAEYFDSIEIDVRNREFHSVTGVYKGKRVSVVSHGIGTDNIDIVLTEIDALFNIDLTTRQVKDSLQILTLIRIGTSGSLQPYLPVGSHCISEVSIGLDTVLHYYAGSEKVIDEDISVQFMEHTGWNPRCGHPYAVHADAELISRFADLEVFDESNIEVDQETGLALITDSSALSGEVDDGKVVIHRGCTLSAVGFYGPQGRELRIPLAIPELNKRIESFTYGSKRITNYEMESSALAGLSALLGHKAVTICTVIANRFIPNALTSYKHALDNLIVTVLERI